MDVNFSWISILNCKNYSHKDKIHKILFGLIFFFIEQISIAFKKCMRYSQTLNVIILKFIKIRRKKLCESQPFKKQRLQCIKKLLFIHVLPNYFDIYRQCFSSNQFLRYPISTVQKSRSLA